MKWRTISKGTFLILITMFALCGCTPSSDDKNALETSSKIYETWEDGLIKASEGVNGEVYTYAEVAQ